MRKFVNTSALAAAFVAVCFTLLRDYGVIATFKRAAIAYFAFYAISSVLAMVFRAGIQDDWARDDWKQKQMVVKKKEDERLQREADRQAERDRRKDERKKQLVGEES